jgi:predicted kinase
MPKLTLLVGPPGSGKSTIAKDLTQNDGDHGAATVYINQDSQGAEHIELFMQAITEKKDVIVDRMNFNKQQRERYLGYVKHFAPDYKTEIWVLHQPYAVCLERVRNRFGKHETINDEKSARGALGTFFNKYERPQEDEADKIRFCYPEGVKPRAIVCDLDGTLCNVEHRRHHVRRTDGQKKDWKSFFKGIPEDTVNKWCAEILHTLGGSNCIVLCSGRDTNHQRATEEWLKRHEIRYDALYMRDRNDSRQDSIVKEILLDFEILTRYEPYFMIDDRQQVVDMWRKRGFVCLQCDEGDF